MVKVFLNHSPTKEFWLYRNLSMEWTFPIRTFFRWCFHAQYVLFHVCDLIIFFLSVLSCYILSFYPFSRSSGLLMISLPGNTGPEGRILIVTIFLSRTFVFPP